MDKVLQEFRIIETDDGFRIEIKGDKEQLREFVMNLDPRRWMHGPHGEHGWGPGPFGPRFGMRFRRGFGPFGMMWDWDEDDEDDDRPRRKRGHGHSRRGRERRHQGGHHHGDEAAPDTI